VTAARQSRLSVDKTAVFAVKALAAFAAFT
jgi:hypothetical protein